jgi:hypothetical protein
MVENVWPADWYCVGLVILLVLALHSRMTGTEYLKKLLCGLCSSYVAYIRNLDDFSRSEHLGVKRIRIQFHKYIQFTHST